MPQEGFELAIPVSVWPKTARVSIPHRKSANQQIVNSHAREVCRYCHQIQRFGCCPAGSSHFSTSHSAPLRFILLGAQSKHWKTVHTFLFKNVYRHVKGFGKHIRLVTR
jgi:hypothetical protein